MSFIDTIKFPFPYYGDLATFKPAPSWGEKQLSIPGRIVAKIDNNSVALMPGHGFFGVFGTYIFVPWKTNSAKYQDIIDETGMTGIPEDFKDIKLEWGEYPKKDKWIVVSRNEFIQFLTDEDIQMLKAMGSCPRCGDDGDWINFALVCQWHGKFIG